MVSSRTTIARALPALAPITIVAACSLGEAGPAPPTIGDPNPFGNPVGRECTRGDDCRTGVCRDAICQPATNTDGVKNGDESDVDCGGAAGPGCSSGKACATNANCARGLICIAFRCSPNMDKPVPNAMDGKQNGGETDVDCGGPDVAVPRCENGRRCLQNGDCASDVCVERTCAPETAIDGIKNGDETDVDCGGSNPRKCAAGKACRVGADCASKACDPATSTCKAASPHDGIKNGTETDVDCGGPDPIARCKAGKSCLVHSDCESNGCAFDGKCAMGASCTQLEGGHTCGPIDTMAKQNDCCDRAQIGGVTIDKYLVTAGRMRAFLARVGGDVRAFAASLPADRWNQAWTPALPTSIDGPPGSPDNAHTQLGPFFGKRSCQSGNYNGHTYWTPLVYGDDKQDFPREVLDTKALNCVPWYLLAALCAFDGGHLALERELYTAYTNANTTPYPWGQRGSYSTRTSNPYAVQFFGYATPNPPPDARRNGQDFLDSAYYIAPPGRRPAGYNSVGVADLVGNLLEWVGDSERQFVWNGSWENHAAEADGIEPPAWDDDPYMAVRPGSGRPWRWHVDISTTEPNGYYAIGGRCAY